MPADDVDSTPLPTAVTRLTEVEFVNHNQNPFAPPTATEDRNPSTPVNALPSISILIVVSIANVAAVIGTMASVGVSVFVAPGSKGIWQIGAVAASGFCVAHAAVHAVCLRHMVLVANPHWIHFSSRVIVTVTTLVAVVTFATGIYMGYVGGVGLLGLVLPVFIPPAVSLIMLKNLVREVNLRLPKETPPDGTQG